jgi:hypothetical protein
MFAHVHRPPVTPGEGGPVTATPAGGITAETKLTKANTAMLTGPDADFEANPVLFDTPIGGGMTKVVAGQQGWRGPRGAAR